jgi:glycosidase
VSVVVRLLSLSLAAAALFACDALAGSDPLSGGGSPPAQDGGPGPGTGPTADGGATDGPAGDADTGPCTTDFRFVPPAGKTYTTVAVTGEWNNWDPKGVTLTPDGKGAFTASVELPPGLVGYKLALDGTLGLDPGARLRKYVGGVENSAIKVVDCHVPGLSVKAYNVDRGSPGQGHFAATVLFAPGKGGPALDPKSLAATMRKDGATSSAQAQTAQDGSIAVDATGLADGKYTIFVDAADGAGKKASTLRLVFWVEAQKFEWSDAVVYMAMTDRFKNGDPSNDAAPTANVDPRADFEGGDLAGIKQAIDAGTFDQLGVRALWLSPYHTNPKGAWLAADGVHLSMGYHGYWPVKAREVEARIGGGDALKALVASAHARGIRVLQDFVVNHVHQDHEYFAQHPNWFRTGCICGTNNCGWTEHRLDCMFSSYMPDVNWTVPEVVDAWSEDAVWWIDQYDLDGLRIDAVKHVEDICTINMSARLRGEFENAGTRLFLTGETAMGWEGDNPASSQSDYDTISRYIGPNGLDGQADFVTYYAVPVTAFVSDSSGHNMPHVDFWTKYAGTQYPVGAIMTPYIGSHDTPRFVTLASQPATAGNQWTNAAPAPSGSDAYQRQRVAFAWLLGIPGAPMMYYGDEYGEWGGADPNNRVMWRGDGALSADEQATLDFVRKLGKARQELTALRRGQYVSVLSNDEQTLVFARQAGTDVALVATTKSTTPVSRSVPLPTSLGIADGAVLRDRVSGTNVTVSGGAVNISLGARGAAVLAP